MSRNSIHIFDAINRLEFVLNRISFNVYKEEYWRQFVFREKGRDYRLNYCILPELNGIKSSHLATVFEKR